MKVNCIFLGMNGVGKTCFLSHFREDKRVDSYVPTIGVDFFVYKMLNIWDSSGQPRYRSILPSFIKTSHLCVIMYNDSTSFEAVVDYINLVKKHGLKCVQTHIVYTGKGTMQKEGLVLANKHKFEFVQCDPNNVEACQIMLDDLCRLYIPILEMKHIVKHSKRNCWWWY